MTLQSFFSVRRTADAVSEKFAPYHLKLHLREERIRYFHMQFRDNQKNWSNNNKLHPCSCHKLFCTYNPTCSYLVDSSYIKQQ